MVLMPWFKKGGSMLRVIEQRESATRDCWGRPEYDTIYVVIDDNNKEVYRSTSNPEPLLTEFEKRLRNE